MKKQIILGLALLLPVVGQAKSFDISVDLFGYPSPAAMHLDILQKALAKKAVDTCGSRELVTIFDVKIAIENGVDSSNSVAFVDDDSSLGFVYPKMTATATLTCADSATATPTVEGHAAGFIYDGGDLEAFVEKLKKEADADAVKACGGAPAKRVSSDYDIKKTRIDKGFRHGWNYGVEAKYECQKPN